MQPRLQPRLQPSLRRLTRAHHSPAPPQPSKVQRIENPCRHFARASLHALCGCAPFIHRCQHVYDASITHQKCTPIVCVLLCDLMRWLCCLCRFVAIVVCHPQHTVRSTYDATVLVATHGTSAHRGSDGSFKEDLDVQEPGIPQGI